jgi:hypothetical protein
MVVVRRAARRAGAAIARPFEIVGRLLEAEPLCLMAGIERQVASRS